MQSQVKAPECIRLRRAIKQAQRRDQQLADVLKQGLGVVNQTQQNADALATSFQRGTPGVELADVMIEMQKANVSSATVAEVRNRMVSAYQEIMNMQI